MALHTDEQIKALHIEHLMDQEDAGIESFEAFNERYQSIMAAHRGRRYNVHIRTEWDTDEANERVRKSRPAKHACKSLEEVEALFDKNCQRVIDNRLMGLLRLEVKEGHRVLFAARFIHCERQ